jgi:hypothetical protein
VAAADDDRVAVLDGALGDEHERGDDAVAHELEPAADLQLLDVLGHVARGHPAVDDLEPGERAELLDARLHVVAQHPLARGDRGEVDVVDDRLVGLDGAVRDGTPRSACARRTAIHSSRSRRMRPSGRQTSTIAALA